LLLVWGFRLQLADLRIDLVLQLEKQPVDVPQKDGPPADGDDRHGQCGEDADLVLPALGRSRNPRQVENGFLVLPFVAGSPPTPQRVPADTERKSDFRPAKTNDAVALKSDGSMDDVIRAEPGQVKGFPADGPPVCIYAQYRATLCVPPHAGHTR
jgi:hypothetical protein